MDPEVKRILEELKELFGKDDTSARERKVALKLKAEALVLDKKNIKEIEKSSKAFKENSKELQLSKKEIKDWDDAISNSVNEHKKYEKSLRDVGGAVLGLGRAAWAGEGSISAFTDNLRGFNVIGDAFAGLGTRLDTNIETFRQLSQVGANFGQSIVQMRQAAGQALLPLDDFASLVASNAENLAALFGSTSVGAQRIAELSEGLRATSVESLAPLRFTIDEINDTLLLNLERQRRTFNFDANARTENIQSAFNFAKQLDRLAKLTGAQREELQRQIEAQMSNERFQAMLAGTTDKTRQRLENFAASIATISPELAEGFQDLIANAGRPVTEAALALVQNMPAAQSAIQNLIAGTTTTEQALIAVRNEAIKSQERFRLATVTGTVEFLRLQGGVIKLGATALDLNSVLAEQAALSPKLTQGLTTFQDATKRLSGQFQKIETGLLASFGPALGGFVTGLQGIMGGLGNIANILAGIPALTGTALASIIVGRYMFDKATQIGIIAAGTAIGTGKLTGLLGRVGGAAGAAGKFGLTRALPAAGAVLGIGSSAGMLMDEDKSNDAAGKGGLAGAAAGAALGAAIGSIVPGLGTVVGGLIGAGLGSFGGQAVGGMFGGEKAFGGPLDTGRSYLVGEKGPELITTGTSSTVTANDDLKETFNTETLEKHLASISSGITAANKIHNTALETLNTSNIINNKTRLAAETSARKDRNQVGIV